jgi:hypothetical protein
MMADRLDAMVARENNGKTYWTKLGVAWPSKNGEGYTVVLDAMPAPVDGQFKISLFPPKPRDNAPSGGRGSSNAGSPNTGYADRDEIPF